MIEKIFKFINDHNMIFRGISLVLGCAICAIVYNSFTVPNKLVYGGFGGLAILVNHFAGVNTTLFLNVAIGLSIILSFFVFGIKGTMHALIGYIVYAIMLNLTEPIAHYFTFSFDSQLFTVLFYAIMSGTGSGLIYRPGFNTGGSDTILLIIQRRFKIPYELASNITNGIIILFGIITFGYVKTIYALICLFTINKVCNAIVIGLSSKKMIFINSKKYKDVIEVLKKDLDVGYTLISSTNGINIFKNTVIMCVVPNYRFYVLKNKVQLIDDRATFYSNDCYNVVNGRTNQIIPL